MASRYRVGLGLHRPGSPRKGAKGAAPLIVRISAPGTERMASTFRNLLAAFVLWRAKPSYPFIKVSTDGPTVNAAPAFRQLSGHVDPVLSRATLLAQAQPASVYAATERSRRR